MKVPLHLRRRSCADPADALLISGNDVAGLLRLCSELGLDPSRRVYGLDGAFLVTLATPQSRFIPGALKLRALVPKLYLPADADIVPALLADEAEGLVRGRGLVFLPWGGVLAFDPTAPLALPDLVTADLVPAREWRPLPEPPAIAQRIEEIVLERSDESPESLFESYGDEVGTEQPGPQESGPASNVIGRATLGAGKGLMWLGHKLGLPSLSGLGAGWVGGAIRMAPQLSESVLGHQAAALRALLREFREGNTDRALRRALPLGEMGGDRGGVVETGDQLPASAFSYSLDQLLDLPGRKRVGVWVGGQDVLAELSREYRKAAELAIIRGDYRRAALIYGKLLRDYRAAANALVRGGLHRDAAILLLTRLDDARSAAREFEAAGEPDRAVELYRRVGDHEAAGDVLLRIGEDDAALREYQHAADRVVQTTGGHLAAGRLMAKKAKRPDLALAHFLAGWERRPLANALACAIEALALLADSAAAPEILKILGEAEEYLGVMSSGSEIANFFNLIAALADKSALASIRDEMRDRALRGLAAQIRREVSPGTPPGRVVSEYLGRDGNWPAALLRDADYAVKAVTKSAAPLPRIPRPAAAVKRTLIAPGAVTAVCSCPGTDEIFVGFEEGAIYCLCPDRSEVHLVAAYDLPVASLAVGHDGSSLVVLRSGAHEGSVTAYSRSMSGYFRLMQTHEFDGFTDPWLTPIARLGGEDHVGLWDGHELYLMTVAALSAAGSLSLPRDEALPTAALILPRQSEPEVEVLVHDGREWCLVDATDRPRRPTGLLWRPSLPNSHPLKSFPLSWDAGRPGHLEMVGLGGHGTIHWAMLRFEDGRLGAVSSNNAARVGGYLAACLIRSRIVAAVTASHVEWLRCGADRFTLASTTDVDLPAAIACFASRGTGELIVIEDDGHAAVVPHRF